MKIQGETLADAIPARENLEAKERESDQGFKHSAKET